MGRLSDGWQRDRAGADQMSLDNIIKAAQKRHASDPSPAANLGNVVTTLHIDQIQDRNDPDTRSLNLVHVAELAESIAIVGLINPISVDNKGRLLAGAHRREAIRQLHETNPQAFERQVPQGQVLVRRYDFDATEDPDRALTIEASENEKRRDYTPAEVRTLADRLRAAGYRDARGKPKRGEKALRPALEVIIGKSGRTVQRYLAGGGEVAGKPKLDNTTAVVLLSQAVKALEKWEQSDEATKSSSGIDKLRDQLPYIKQTLANAIADYLDH